MSEVKGNYPPSLSGKYKVIDSIGVPHPYCIGSKLVAWAADHWNGMLGREAIADAERHGIHCEICKGKIPFDEHKQALLVSCPPDGINESDRIEIQDWLKMLVPETEKNGYAGFAFMKRKTDKINRR